MSGGAFLQVRGPRSRIRRGRRPAWAVCGVSLLVPLLVACGGSGPARKVAKPGLRSYPASSPADAPIDATEAQLAYTPTGRIVATDGFDPQKDGFAYENYGDKLPAGPGLAPAGDTSPTDLTPKQMQALYGNVVCADRQCDLTPEAQAWMNERNQSMAEGHCYGFSDAALQFFVGQAQARTYGAATVPQLKLDGNPNLQSFIAQNFAYQFLPSVANAEIAGSTSTIIDTLKQALVPNPREVYTIGIFQADGSGGHAVTPYAIEDNGNGQFHILIYDNNFPRITRAISVDTNADTWQYTGGINPSDTSELYQGSPQNQLTLSPTTPALSQQPWPYSGTAQQNAAGNSGAGNSGAGNSGGGAGSSGSGNSGASSAVFPPGPNNTPAFLVDYTTGTAYDDIYLDGGDVEHGHLLITDSEGRHIGYLNGSLVNTIPGAHILNTTNNQDWAESSEPDYLVPDGFQYSITVDGSSLQQQDQGEDVGLIAPGYDVEVDNINLNPGEQDTVTVSRDGSQVSYKSGSTQAPVIYYGVSDATSDYTFALSGDDLGAGGTLKLSVPLNSADFTFSTATTAHRTNSVSIGLDKEDDNGSYQFESDGIALADGDTATLKAAGWKPGQSMTLVAVQNGHTNTESLEDQAGSGGSSFFGNSGDSGSSGSSGSGGSGSGNS